jgi:hypothetical protein
VRSPSDRPSTEERPEAERRTRAHRDRPTGPAVRPTVSPNAAAPAPAPERETVRDRRPQLADDGGTQRFRLAGGDGGTQRFRLGQDRLWSTREVFKSCAKSFRTLRLYPPSHSFCRKASDDFNELLQACLRVVGTLHLTVSERNLLLDGESVYEESDLKENLARRLFVDGLRELTVEGGVSALESEAFLSVLFEGISTPEADVGGLLEDAMLDHISFEATSALADAWEPPEYLSSESFQAIESMNEDVDSLVASLTKNVVAGEERHSFELSDGAREADEIAEGDEGLIGEKADKDELYPVGDAELEAQRENLARWGPSELLLTCVDACLVDLVTDVEGEDLSWVLSNATENALRSRDLGLLVTLLVRYHDALEAADDKGAETARSLLAQQLEWANSEQTRERILELLSIGFLGGSEAFLGLVDLLATDGKSLTTEAILRTENEGLREQLLGVLGDSVQTDLECVRPLLGAEVPGPVAHSVLFMLSKRAAPGPAMNDLLSFAGEHPDGKTSEYATHLRRTLTPEGRLEQTVDALFAANRRDRLNALKTLVEDEVVVALPLLGQVMEQDDFLTRDAEERATFIAGATTLGGKRAYGILLGLSKRKGSFLKTRKAAKEVREAAQEAMRGLLRTGNLGQ